MRRLFLPSARQLKVVIILGVLALGYALYMRYLVIQQTLVGLACDGGLLTWLCVTRKAIIALFQHWVFGWVAIGAAVLNLLRPSFVVLAIGIVAAALGIVLYNVGLSALAVAFLILSLARPATETGPT